jgi:hypothetical protein
MRQNATSSKENNMLTTIDRIITKATAWREQYQYDRVLNPADVSRIDPRSLLFYYGNIHSQRGQDGILAEIFRRLGITDGVFVEFGAWDGMYLCNSRWLYEKGWRGIFIEGQEERYKKLCRLYAHDKNISKVHSFVGAPSFRIDGVRLAELVQTSGTNPNDVKFLSIDVDGPDLEIFLDAGFKPPVVLLEGGFNYSPYLKADVSAAVAHANLQYPIQRIFDAVTGHGYVPVCFYQDSYLVRADLAAPFEDCARNAIEMYKEACWFMPKSFREHLLAMRQASSVIRDIETKHFGEFHADPLSEAYRRIHDDRR